MLMFRRRSMRELFSISNGFFFFFRSQALPYSTLSSSKTHLNLMTDYLINSLGFSREEAISVSSKSKVTHLKSTLNSDLVVNIFKDYGLDNTQIRFIVSCVPKVLTLKANQTLEPKIKIFHQLGLSGSDLVKLIKKNPTIFSKGLSTQLIPIIDFLRNFLGSNQKVIEAINNSKWLISSTGFRRISANVMLLQDYGLPNENIAHFLIKYPMNVSRKPELLEAPLYRVEEEFGISRKSRLFIHVMNVVIWYSKSAIEKKLEVFKRFGWSDSEISTLVRAHPLCLTLSEAHICEKLKFFMKELEYTPAYLTTYPLMLSFSMEKRVKPRHRVLELLKEKKLVDSKPSLASLAKYSELQFQKFIRRFENEVPELHEIYISSMT